MASTKWSPASIYAAASFGQWRGRRLRSARTVVVSMLVPRRLHLRRRPPRGSASTGASTRSPSWPVRRGQTPTMAWRRRWRARTHASALRRLYPPPSPKIVASAPRTACRTRAPMAPVRREFQGHLAQGAPVAGDANGHRCALRLGLRPDWSMRWGSTYSLRF
jgi:hypothetical protein